MLQQDTTSTLDTLFSDLPEITRLISNETSWMGLPRDAQLKIDLLRLDKIHPFLSGNKWYKLKQHLKAAHAAGKTQLLSFGGAHSNHLHALAYAGKELGIDTIGVVRGEPAETLTPTLQDCVQWGMSLEWISRRDYRAIAPIADQDHSFAETHPHAWIIPEGGSGQFGIEGVRELFIELSRAGQIDHNVIMCPVGTGTTLAGIAAAGLKGVRCVGFSALKEAHGLEHDLELALERRKDVGHWEISHDYHFGGFAKLHDRLRAFISDFHEATEIVLDPVYTGKMLFGVTEWIRQGRLPEHSRVLLVHTGGLQGWRGFGEVWPLVGDDE